MQVEKDKLDISNFFYEQNNNLKAGELNEIHQYLEPFPFVYKTPDKTLFRLVIEWLLILKDDKQTFEILKLEGSQEFMIRMEYDNNDLPELTNAVEGSFNDFQSELINRTAKTILMHYRYPKTDWAPTAGNILRLAQQ